MPPPFPGWIRQPCVPAKQSCHGPPNLIPADPLPFAHTCVTRLDFKQAMYSSVGACAPELGPPCGKTSSTKPPRVPWAGRQIARQVRARPSRLWTGRPSATPACPNHVDCGGRWQGPGLFARLPDPGHDLSVPIRSGWGGSREPSIPRPALLRMERRYPSLSGSRAS